MRDHLIWLEDRVGTCVRDDDRIAIEISFSIRARRKFCTRALVTVCKRVYQLALAEKLSEHFARNVTREEIRVRL